MTAAPFSRHQFISRNLEYILHQYCLENNWGEVLYAPIAVIFSHTDIVEPDLVFIRKKHEKRIQEKGIVGSPDLIVEILSPSTEKIDRTIKKKLYARYGVAEYWLVDTDNKYAEILLLEKNNYKRKGIATDTFQSDLFPGLTIELRQVFKGTEI